MLGMFSIYTVGRMPATLLFTPISRAKKKKFKISDLLYSRFITLNKYLGYSI